MNIWLSDTIHIKSAIATTSAIIRCSQNSFKDLEIAVLEENENSKLAQVGLNEYFKQMS